MNCEENRLRTFSSWPTSVPISVQQLSSNGFFSTGNGLEAECNWCHLQIRGWEGIENIELYHNQANPQCEFVVNKQNCGNVTIEKNLSSLDLLLEKNRLATFVNWPNPNITPQSLAKAGFFYRNRSDEVECAWCKGVIAKWEKEDNASEEHRKFFPGCPRVILGPHIDGVRDLGIQQITPPKNPKYTSLHTRLETYTNWPIPDIQKPEKLAQAGLYYQKVDDQVRCFHCNMGLRSWEKEDDPWFEHAKWYPMCDFVRLVKGVNFIKEVQEKTRNVQKSDNPIVPISTEEAMATEPVKLALQMGIDYDTLLNKTQQKILTTGRPFVTVEDLLKSVFDEEENTNNDLSTVNPSSLKITTPIDNDHNNEQLCSTPLSVNKENVVAEIPESSDTVVLQSKQADKKDRLLLEEENRKLKDARLCKICLDEEVGVVYIPCGHLVTCVQCAPSVNQCPMCRTAIKYFVRTYLS